MTSRNFLTVVMLSITEILLQLSQNPWPPTPLDRDVIYGRPLIRLSFQSPHLYLSLSFLLCLTPLFLFSALYSKLTFSYSTIFFCLSLVSFSSFEEINFYFTFFSHVCKKVEHYTIDVFFRCESYNRKCFRPECCKSLLQRKWRWNNTPLHQFKMKACVLPKSLLMLMLLLLLLMQYLIRHKGPFK